MMYYDVFYDKVNIDDFSEIAPDRMQYYIDKLKESNNAVELSYYRDVLSGIGVIRDYFDTVCFDRCLRTFR